jgi:hypothetical protein
MPNTGEDQVQPCDGRIERRRRLVRQAGQGPPVLWPQGRVFMVTADRRPAGDPRQWRDDRLPVTARKKSMPGTSAGRRRRHGDRGSARHPLERVRRALPRLSARSRRQQAVRASPAAAVTLETISEVKAHGGVQGVYRHASAATGTDMTFSLFMPPQVERASRCRCCGICRG